MDEFESAVPSRSVEPGSAVDPRDRLLRDGAESLSAAELLGLVLRENSRTEEGGEVAGRLLRRFGGLRATATRTVPELMTVPGIGPARAARLKAAFALASAVSRERLPRGAHFRTARDVFERFHDELRDQKRETFYSVLLDGKNRVIREDRVSQGSLTSSIVHPREVFATAIRESADAVVFVHNHPSGDPTPSLEDLEITKRLVEVSRLVGIRILDHIVIGDGEYTSFQERGLLDEP
jgi:DNA repair protein RadC